MNNFEPAIAIAQGLADKNPDEIASQIFLVEVLASAPCQKDRTKQKIAAIRALYNLEMAFQCRLSDIERIMDGNTDDPA
jgi:hypothetical protein